MIDQYDSLAEKFLKKGFWLYLFSFIIGPLGYFVKIIISHDLTVSEVGILYGIISLITLLTAFNDFGMTESLKKFVPKFIIEEEYGKIKSILSYTLLIQLGTGLILTAFFYFGAPAIATHFFKTDAAIQSLQIFSLYFI